VATARLVRVVVAFVAFPRPEAEARCASRSSPPPFVPHPEGKRFLERYRRFRRGLDDVAAPRFSRSFSRR
jgi:hypothetical protein